MLFRSPTVPFILKSVSFAILISRKSFSLVEKKRSTKTNKSTVRESTLLIFEMGVWQKLAFIQELVKSISPGTSFWTNFYFADRVRDLRHGDGHSGADRGARPDELGTRRAGRYVFTPSSLCYRPIFNLRPDNKSAESHILFFCFFAPVSVERLREFAGMHHAPHERSANCIPRHSAVICRSQRLCNLISLGRARSRK